MPSSATSPPVGLRLVTVSGPPVRRAAIDEVERSVAVTDRSLEHASEELRNAPQ